MSRILFKKEGRAKFISHLDLMRTMQRAFIRAGLPIKHTEGFNPHPYMVFAMPLSVGTESVCELMDFKLVTDVPLGDVPGLLNRALPEGIEVTRAYEETYKFKDIKWLDIEADLFYDNKVTDEGSLLALLTGDKLVMEKKTKRSTATVDVRPLIAACDVKRADEGGLTLRARLAVGDPALSPAQLISAVEQNAPFFAPDFARFRRLELYDKDIHVFR